jgi:hypothetical protein
LELVRAHGVREVLKGVGLLTRGDPRPWLWGRLAGDALDLAVLSVTLRRPEVPFAWRLVSALTAVGLTIVDVLAVRELGTQRRGDVIGMDLTPEPRESWRGDGLAERQRGEAQPMGDAQEQLGLSDPGSQDMHRV